jgi:hypothetical protein
MRVSLSLRHMHAPGPRASRGPPSRCELGPPGVALDSARIRIARRAAELPGARAALGSAGLRVIIRNAQTRTPPHSVTRSTEDPPGPCLRPAGGLALAQRWQIATGGKSLFSSSRGSNV